MLVKHSIALWLFNVIQGHRFICNLKASMQLPISDQKQFRPYLAPFCHRTSMTKILQVDKRQQSQQSLQLSGRPKTNKLSYFVKLENDNRNTLADNWWPKTDEKSREHASNDLTFLQAARAGFYLQANAATETAVSFLVNNSTTGQIIPSSAAQLPMNRQIN